MHRCASVPSQCAATDAWGFGDEIAVVKGPLQFQVYIMYQQRKELCMHFPLCRNNANRARNCAWDRWTEF